jgi:hypothetical protein
MPNYGYHLARARARIVEAAYKAALPFTVTRKVRPDREIGIDVFAYSSERRVAEQIASIRSFLIHAGRPSRFVVVSDGSHTGASTELLRRTDPCVQVEQVPQPAATVPESVAPYFRDHPTGKQLALIMSLPRQKPALYVDSDVLFFPAASELETMITRADAPADYLPDCGFAGDARLLKTEKEAADPVNTGVLFIREPLDWSSSIERLTSLGSAPTFFTNQTLTHLAMHANGAKPLDSSKYVLQLDDQFVYRDRYAGPDIVLRHYVDPVRHKFWNLAY